MKEDQARHLQKVYSQRDLGKIGLYAWHRAEMLQQNAAVDRNVARVLLNSFGEDLSGLHVLDVGCGSGHFLRKLVEWGARPEHLTGTEFLPDRIDVAKKISAQGIRWKLGNLTDIKEQFDLVTAFTVFSSLLSEEDRSELATAMWDKVKPGGWIIIFDFRVNNPSNANVRKVTYSELQRWWPSSGGYSTLILAPPLARRITPVNYLLSEIMTALFPFLRTHFIYAVQKKVLS